MLKEDIEKLIRHKNEKIMITYPTLFLKYIEEAEEEEEAIYSQIASWEWSFEEWFKEEKYV